MEPMPPDGLCCLIVRLKRISIGLRGINGAWKICQKIWNLTVSNQKYLEVDFPSQRPKYVGESLDLIKLIHQNLNGITQSIEKFQMNVVIAKVFEIVNALSKFQIKNKTDEYVINESLKILIRVIEPMVPHLAEECWTFTKSDCSISEVPWPIVNKEYLINREVTVVIQINGKRRGEIILPKDSSEKDVYKKISNVKNIKDALNGKNIIKSVYVPNKILNIVVN